jgi:hypothetical protein
MQKLFAFALASATAVSTAAFAAPTQERVRGTVASIDATTLVVHTATGVENVALTSKTHYLDVKKSSLGNITAGSYIGTATKAVGPELIALEVVIFPPAMKGTGEGHYDWDKINDTTKTGTKTKSSMTNGSVTSVMHAPKVSSTMTNGSVAGMAGPGGSQKLTVTYDGGQQTILVPPTAPIVTFVPGAMSDVTAGSTVFVNGLSDGKTITAAAVAVGVDGATPPM